jgi:hypothetical protein
VVEGGQGQAAACPVEQGVVDGEQDRLVGAQEAHDQVEQQQPEVVGPPPR